MHLSGLEIQGFKSFPNKTKLTFARGVMAIVGPNGCGKTNIVDAVRWVLGEQRSTVLRSEKMEHVIFAGSLHQKPAAKSEVTLILENDRNILPEEFTELAITRRLTRDGDSDYLINRRPSRLKDIKNLFADTGLGPDSYSIIELKMVETILSARTDERRRLFEEAAGVTGYKAKLKTTRHRLNETRTDLTRLADLLNEVTSRRNSLKRQVNKARRYRHLREALRVIELKASSAEIIELRAKVAPLEEQLVADRTSRDNLAQQVDRDRKTQHELHGKLSVLEETLQTLGAEKSQAFDRLTNTRREIDVLEERIRSGHSRSEKRDEEEKILTQRLVDIAQELNNMAQQDERATDRAREIEQRLEGMRVSWDAIQERVNSHSQRRDNAERERVKAEREQARVDGELKRSEERLIQVNDQLQINQKADLPEAPEDPENARNELERLNTELTAAETKLADARSNEESLRSELNESEKTAVGMGRDLNSAKERVEFLQRIIQSGVGRSEAVQALLTADLDDVYGRLGDAVVIKDESVRVAIAAALEPWSDAVIVADSGMQSAVEFLQSQKHGRATLATYNREASVNHQLPDDKRITPLLNYIDTSGDAGNVAREHLSFYGLVQDLPTLLDLAPEAKNEFGLVTAEGCVLHPDGSISAGRATVDDLGAAGLLDDATQLQNDLQAAHEAMEIELTSARQQSDQAMNARIEAETLRKQVREALRAQDSILRRTEEDWRNFESLKARASEEHTRLIHDRDQLLGSIETLKKELKDAAAALKDANGLYSEIRERSEDLRQESDAQRTARDQLREKQVEASSSLARVRGELNKQQSLKEEYEHQLERLQQERESAGGALEDAVDRQWRIKGETKVLEKNLEDKSSTLAKSRKEYERLQNQRSEIDGILAQRREDQTRLSDRVHTRELEQIGRAHV